MSDLVPNSPDSLELSASLSLLLCPPPQGPAATSSSHPLGLQRESLFLTSTGREVWALSKGEAAQSAGSSGDTLRTSGTWCWHRAKVQGCQRPVSKVRQARSFQRMETAGLGRGNLLAEGARRHGREGEDDCGRKVMAVGT